MKKLSEFLNVEKLESLIAEGYISRKFHNEYPLAILNYTPMAQYDPKLIWGDEMNWCRGLIYCTETNELVAIPFKKFWNINDERHPETMVENLPNEVPLFLEKLDGSMGVLFEWNHLNHVATRGSFHSDQAEWATNWLRIKYPRLSLPKDSTILAEIIYDQNKIVVDYDFEGLVILGAVNKTTGVEVPRNDVKSYCRAMGLGLVKEYKQTLAESLSEDVKNREGYVLTFPSTGIKVKVKFSTYCTLHSLLTQMNPKAIWKLKREGENEKINEYYQSELLPESFKKWLRDWDEKLTTNFNEIILKTRSLFDSKPITDIFMPYKESRKIIASYFTREENRPYSGLLFAMLDGKDISDLVWKMIEPFGTAFKAEDN